MPLPLPKSQSGASLRIGVTPKSEDIYDLNLPPVTLDSDRVLASTIDGALNLTPIAVATLISASSSPDTRPANLIIVFLFGLLLSLTVWVAQCWAEGEKGHTFGKKILGMVTVSRRDAATIGFQNALLRGLVKWTKDAVSIIVAFGHLGVKENSTHMSYADEAAGTVVVYDRRRVERKDGLR